MTDNPLFIIAGATVLVGLYVLRRIKASKSGNDGSPHVNPRTDCK